MNSRSENKYMAANIGINLKNAYQASNTKTEISSVDGQIEFTWTVEGDLFEAFLNAGTGEGFESNEFVFSDGIWKLKCYPNGTKKYGQGNVSLFLAVMKLPTNVIQMGVQYEFECREVNYKDEYGSELTNIFNKKHSSWGYPETFKRNLLINLQKKILSIRCCMKKVLLVSIVTMPNISGGSSSSISSYTSDGEIISDKEKINKTSHNVVWYIDPNMIRLWSSASASASTPSSSTKQSFDSTSFPLHRSKWCLQCYPSGDKYANSGMVSLYLKLLEFPDNSAYHIRNMKVKMQFECQDIQYQSNEFLHTYDNKKQEVYFGISSAFNNNTLNYLNKNQGIAISCRIDLVSVSINGEKWWHCIRERDSLKAKHKRIEYEHKEQNKKLQSQTQYICNKVIVSKEKEVGIRDKIKRMNDESEKILKEHSKILKEWDITTVALNRVVMDNNCNINILKEEKKEEHHLLSEYSKCRLIMDKQENRLEQVTKKVSILLAQQTQFLQRIEEWQLESSQAKNGYINLLKKYNDVKNERMELQKVLSEKVSQCNHKIDEENALNKKKCNKDNELNAMVIESAVFGAMSKECKILIEKYNHFVNVNNENITRLNKYIRDKWNNFENNWIEWNGKDIMAFIKFKMHWFNINGHLFNNEIDLNVIELNIVKQGICGLQLVEFSKNDLYCVGFTNYQLRCQIFDHIRILRTKYPAPINRSNIANCASITANGSRKEERLRSHSNTSDASVTSQDNNIIPSQFMCPITKNLMTEPVMAFDGYTYEKAAIEEYLKKYKKSPKTKKDAHTLYTFPNLQLQQEIQTFREVNSFILMEGDDETYNIE